MIIKKQAMAKNLPQDNARKGSIINPQPVSAPEFRQVDQA
jgi:hypothetical protein